MKRIIRAALVLAVAAVLLPAGAERPAEVSPGIESYLRSNAPGPVRAWVFLDGRDRMEPAVEPSQRALRRRGQRGRTAAADAHDRPVSRRRVAAVAGTGARVRCASRYLNAVSVTASREQIHAIRGLEGVTRVARVATYRRSRTPAAVEAPARAPAGDDYGASRAQLENIGVIPLHDDGYHGEGILIGVFDTGFNRAHDALDHLDVVAEWDFVFDDSVTSNETEDWSQQHSHGTNVLSTIAGYAPGELIGPAWASGVVLAKTERVFEEVQGEEDDFVRALEWADSIGVDIVTASLGYYDWYEYSDIDGNTAVTTVACDIAASRGITVVSSVGNQGSGGLGWPGVTAPADGDSVIAVGAVDSLGARAGFSSRGPTYDGRIKPDVMAMGVAVRMASAYDSLGYYRANGTSFAAPLVAGACALLLQVHPDWGPAEVLAALRSEASHAAAPDNDYGWGIIDAYQSAVAGATGVLSGVDLSLTRTGQGVGVTLTHAGSGNLSVDLVRRRLGAGSIWDAPETLAAGIALDGGERWRFADDGLAAGVYEYRVRLSADASQVTPWRRVTVPFAMVLRQSAPNPHDFSGGAPVRIAFTIGGAPVEISPSGGARERVEITVYDVRGARVATLFSRLLGPGDYETTWSGRDDRGAQVASGVYFYRMRAGPRSITRKLVVLRP